jgi:hypothetical protein
MIFAKLYGQPIDAWVVNPPVAAIDINDQFAPITCVLAAIAGDESQQPMIH